ncbi:hypothetical protein [Streptosporangium sp. CA-115845]|uniref:hypothetical protein n=1 Tax=Streptosporangium sp. CA-115845 TaxID=3240071 RepID=UPI003D930746
MGRPAARQSLSRAPVFAFDAGLLHAPNFMMIGHHRDKTPGTVRPGGSYVRDFTTGEVVYDLVRRGRERLPGAPGERARLIGLPMAGPRIAWRRNNIAHTADHDPERSGQKKSITAQQAEQTIDLLESIAIAILLALGDLPPTADPDSTPPETGTLGATPPQTATE